MPEIIGETFRFGPVVIVLGKKFGFGPARGLACRRLPIAGADVQDNQPRNDFLSSEKKRQTRINGVQFGWPGWVYKQREREARALHARARALARHTLNPKPKTANPKALNNKGRV